jgi:hypothetical protein
MKRWFPASLLTLLALFAASELVVRVFFARNMSGRFEYGYHPSAGFVENADGTVNLVRAGGRRFHPQHFTRARPADTFRVVVIGDSVPRGSSVQSAYPFLIGERLRDQGVAAESFNLAVAGNGAARSQVILRQALNYEPSLVILHVNDSNEFEDERDFKRAQAFRSWHPRNWPMKSLVLRRLHELKLEKVYWKWLPAEVRNLNSASDADDEALAGRDPVKRREWAERVRRYTAESVALARARGAPVLLLTQARLERDAQGRAYLDDHGLDELVRPLVGPGVCTLSMKEIFERVDFEALFADGAHVFPPGHARITAALVQKLQQSGLVGAAR